MIGQYNTGVVTRYMKRLWSEKAAYYIGDAVTESCAVLGKIAPVDFFLPIVPEVLIGLREMLAAHETARS